jgi:hypothetical protein
MTIHEVLKRGWTPPNDMERVQCLTQIRDKVIILTEWSIYRAESDKYNDFIVYLIGHL